MTACQHENFSAHVAVGRIGTYDDGTVRNFIAEVTVKCGECGLPFHFLGASAGLSFTKPTVNIDATTLHAPISPGPGPLSDKLSYDLGGS